MTQLRQRFFRPPARTPVAWLQIGAGALIMLLVMLGTRLAGWDQSGVTLVLLGIVNVMSGMAERLPRERTTLAGVLRLMTFALALVCLTLALQWLVVSTRLL